MMDDGFLAFGFWLLAFGFWLLAFGFWLLVKRVKNKEKVIGVFEI
jgi:hypothetical protein